MIEEEVKLRRVFDLLSRPLWDEESTDAGANVSWLGARDFVVRVDPSISEFFEVVHSFDKSPWFSVQARRVKHCSDLIRFAAIVECETDESTPQDTLPDPAKWPPLRSSKYIDPPFRSIPVPGGTSAREQILGSRRNLLSSFDDGKRKARGHEVQTYHGRVAEAVFRQWLADFLPKRYGVTSGYVVSQGQASGSKFPHYDVIIYDQLESPVLWTESHPDSSSGGASRAIPVQYVRAVMEVKSTFGSQEVRDAMEHLRDLAPYWAGIDSSEQYYKKYLQVNFFTMVIFFDSTSSGYQSPAALSCLVPSPAGPANFYGGIILRGEGQSEDCAAWIKLFRDDKAEIQAHLLWANHAFPMFVFDIIALLDGTYNGRLSSLFAVESAE